MKRVGDGGHRELDRKVVMLQSDSNGVNDFIVQYQSFVRSCCLHWQRRMFGASYSGVAAGIDNEDIWAVALEAFHEAMLNYDFSRGSFFAFAALVIDRRLIDYYRSETKYSCEIPIDPYVLQTNPEQDEPTVGGGLTNTIREKLNFTPDNALALEIDAATQLLLSYGFSFFDLAESSPKAEKTRRACAQAVLSLLASPILLNEMRASKQLAIRHIEKISGVPRKIIERHRKYIIAATEIMAGDYPYLSQYLRYIREEK